MQKYVLTWLFVICGAVLLNAQTPAQRLRDVKVIFVAPLESHDQGLADMVHAKLISYLSKIPGLSVVEDEENADAILTGSGLAQSVISQYGHPHYFMQAGMRLSSKESGVVLWADDVSSSRFARSASSSFAENVAKRLGRLFADSQKN